MHVIKLVVKIVAVLVLLYMISISLVLKFFLPELVFKKIEEGSTNESSRYSVKSLGDEVLIREYLSVSGELCAFYFPGQGGGIPRYEKEIFKHSLERNISIYAISLPGYEGAAGNSTYESVLKMGQLAVEYINDNTGCKISESVFVGRSLGSVVALEIAATVHPRGLLLDSTGTSLSVVVRNKIQKNPFLKPASILPIEMFMQFNPKIEDAMGALFNTPIVIFQGEFDTLTPYRDIEEFSKNHMNIELIKVGNATHSTAHVDAGVLYFDKLEGLLGG